jgi:hypothetical protein
MDGVIPKDRVLTSGPRDLRWHSVEETEILRPPEERLRSG